MGKPLVVVGSGIIGSSVAWQLQAHGVETLLVGDFEESTVSRFSFASLSAFDEPITELFALKCLGISYWRRWHRELGDLGLSWDGEIRWAETPEAAHVLRTCLARATRRGYGAHAISAGELKDLLPGSSPARVLEAAHAPKDGQLDPTLAIARFRAAFRDAGGTAVLGRASLTFDDDGVIVDTGNGQVEASGVVIASGAETADLLTKIGLDLPMQPSPGLLAITEPTEPVVTGTVYVFPLTWPAIHLRQLRDGRVMIGERSQDHVATIPTAKHARELLRQAQRAFPALNRARIERHRILFRPMPRDGMPIVGPVPGLPSLYVATGHSGITLAPAIAALATQEIVARREAAQLASFRPSRFAKERTHLAHEVESAFDSSR